MTDGQTLRPVAEMLVPGFSDLFDGSDVWDQPLVTGSAFQWTMVAAFISQARQHGWDNSFPAASLGVPSSFALRNELPLHHGAQAGHAAAQRSLDLPARYLQAFVPKVIFHREGRYLSLFVEGCPYHVLMGPPPYKDRPDILLLPGRLTPGYPTLTNLDTQVAFSFDLAYGPTVSGSVRVANAPTISLLKRDPQEGFPIAAGGIIECSVNKTAQTATKQMQRYSTLFATQQGSPPLFLVTGNKVKTEFPGATINLANEDPDLLAQAWQSAAEAAIREFSLD